MNEGYPDMAKTKKDIEYKYVRPINSSDWDGKVKGGGGYGS